MQDVLELREVEHDDLAAVQELIESDPAFTERVTGHPPGPSDALSLAMGRPEGLAEDAKAVLGAWDTATGRTRLTAVVDLLRGYPVQGYAFVGLLQVRWELQGSGVGRSVWEDTENWIRARWPDTSRLRLAVVDTNVRVAEPFWTKVGFAPTGESRPYRYDKLETTARMFEKPL